MRPEKTLDLTTLANNKVADADAILAQVTNGKNNMPAFGGRLSDEQISAVSQYVAYQAKAGWNKEPLYVKYPGRHAARASSSTRARDATHAAHQHRYVPATLLRVYGME